MKNFKSMIKRFLVLTLVLALLFGTMPGVPIFAVSENLLSQPSIDSVDDKGFDRPDSSDTFADEFLPGEVLAPADSWQEAEEIAVVYGLELKSYVWGVAVLTADDPRQVVAQSSLLSNFSRSSTGRDLIPKLSLNSLFSTYEDEMEEFAVSVASDNDSAPEEYAMDSNSGEESRADAEPIISLAVDTDAQWHHEVIDTERAWALSTGEGVVVAVIDTGIDLNHPNFSGKVSVKSYNSHTDQVGLAYVRDDDDHGTHVSGIIAAYIDSVAGVCGIAPEAEILTIKANIPTDTNHFDRASLVRGINYAAGNDAVIVNMSVGRNYMAGGDELEQDAIAKAVAKGVTVICSAGNDRNSHAGYPAAYPEAIAVSSVKEGEIFDTDYSNYGPEVDISAPGTAIYSAKNGGGYMNMTGTSMASPCVAGVAALIKSIHPEYTSQQVRDTLCQTARQAGHLGRDNGYGWGIVNAYGAVLGLDQLYSVTYNFNDGERAPVNVRVIPGNKLIKPEWPRRAGYAFVDWYTSADGEDVFDFSIPISGNITLYAHWQEYEAGMYIMEFPDPKFRQEVLKLLNDYDRGDRTENSIMTPGDIAALASFEILQLDYREYFGDDDNIPIFDITGLSYFTGLTYLSCMGNQLTELDVSKNTALTELICQENQLAELDVSKNIELTVLRCCYNQIGELDVSQNTALEYFDCQRNQLKELELSNNTALDLLCCSLNQLTELDVTKNTRLWYIGCNSNKLSSLDVSNNIILERLYCEYNQLTKLDVSHIPTLEQLYCMENRLREINVSNTALRTIFCYHNYLLSEAAIIGLETIRATLSYFSFSPQYPVINIISQPPSETIVIQGSITGSLNLDIIATMGATVTYQWYKKNSFTDRNGTVIYGEIFPSFKIPSDLTVGEYYYYCVVKAINSTGAEYEATISSDVATVKVIEGAGVSGMIESYDPNKPTTIRLMQAGKEMYATTITGTDGYGQVEQEFAFKGVAPGRYDLVITKDVHSKFTVLNLLVRDEDVDLTKDKRLEVQLMGLRCGDISGDGLINDADLTILWRAGNYNKKAAEADNKWCDLDGDGLINDADLTILWMVYNYNRGEIIIP
ncbi:MAG: S8 family serine peptidase [Clostridiales bacterium]|nr:S8 family serine peptidase [Clostridiales bacterium]